ncbi:MAG: hypothetical protein R6V10_11110 [bacterium]
MKFRLGTSLVLVLLFGGLFVSAPASSGPPAEWVFDLSGEGRFFDLPFPTALRKLPGGGIDMEGFPDALHMDMEDRIRESVSKGYGYSTGPTVYFRFRAPVSRDFPLPVETMEKRSPVFLVNIDPESPDLGKRYPVTARFYPYGPRHMRLSRNLLAIQPVPGFVLDENTQYAAGVFCSLEDKHGQDLPRSPALVDMASGRAPAGALGDKAKESYAPALDALSKEGIQAKELAALTVFRTGDPTARMRKLFQGVKDMRIEQAGAFRKTRDYDLYTVVEGAVDMPQFQTGEPPYGDGESGYIRFDASGRPVVQREERVPLCLTVPKGEMPEEGFPIMIYVHGTGGVSTQVVDRGVKPMEGDKSPQERGMIESLRYYSEHHAEPGTGPALVLARRGIAAAGASQPQNGERGGQAGQYYFYNFFNPEALRDNILQAAAEASLLLRYLQTVELDPSLVPETETGGGPVKFNPELVFGMGQSLGSLILGPWGGVETDVKALIPAGNGAYWSLFITEGNPFDMKTLRRIDKGFGEAVLGMDRYHPTISMLANVLAPADPFAYQPHYIDKPFPGRGPKHVWASFGLYDHYFPPVSQNAAMAAMGLDFAGKVKEPSTKDMIELSDMEKLLYPVRLNKRTDRGDATAVASHYEQHGALDGHHINYQREDAKYQYGCFLDTYVKTGTPVALDPVRDWDAECRRLSD